ncbi:MAG TPA: hypothetical protein DDX68_20070, partial [Clostridium sp.]|nr:hypothetical protein [Clostridium sp.]
MKLKDNKFRYCLMLIAVICLFTGSFFAGMGLQKMFSNQKIRKEYTKSDLQWKQELAEGEDGAIVRDLRNQELVKNMKYVSMERQIYFD